MNGHLKLLDFNFEFLEIKECIEDRFESIFDCIYLAYKNHNNTTKKYEKKNKIVFKNLLV